MRRTLAIVAGAMLLQVATSPLNAGQPGWEGQVRKVQFVAPEPTPARQSATADQGDAFIEEAAPDQAYAPDAPFTATAVGSANTTNAANAVPESFGGTTQSNWCCDPCCDPCSGCARCAGCRMPQHYAYFPPMHGYYYFRPYNASQVPTQQNFARMWGEDPANPYGNRIFQTVYDQYRAAKITEQPAID